MPRFFNRSRAGWTAALACAAGLLVTNSTMAQDRPGGNGNGDDRNAQDDRPDRQDRANRGDRGDRGDRGERGRRGGGERGWGGGRGGFGGGFGGGPMAMAASGMFRPLFMTRDLPVFSQMLTLDDGQRQIVEIVLEDYDAAFQLAAEEARDAVSAMNDDLRNDEATQERFEVMREQMTSIHEEMRAMREASRAEEGSDTPPQTDEERQAQRDAFRSRMSEIRDGFREEMTSRMESPDVQDSLSEQRAIYRTFDSVRRQMNEETQDAIVTILAEDQEAKWNDVMRRIRRERLLPEGRISGESFDVDRSRRDLQDELEPSVKTSIDTIVNGWTLDVDDALQRRDGFDNDARFDAMEAISVQDGEALERVLLNRLRLQQSVRGANDAAIEAIAEALPAPMGDEYRDRALQEGYGRWLRQARSERAIEAALKLEDLEPTLIEAIMELQIDCRGAMADENERVLSAARRHEEPREMGFVRRMGSSGEREEREDTPLDDAVTHRGEVDQEYIEALKDLLGEERSESLPGMRSRDRGWGGDRGNRDSGDRENMRQQFMERFDTNGDGEIDDAERDAIREAFRNGRGGQGGPGQGGPGQGRGGQGRGGQGGGGQGAAGGQGGRGGGGGQGGQPN